MSTRRSQVRPWQILWRDPVIGRVKTRSFLTSREAIEQARLIAVEATESTITVEILHKAAQGMDPQPANYRVQGRQGKTFIMTWPEMSEVDANAYFRSLMERTGVKPEYQPLLPGEEHGSDERVADPERVLTSLEVMAASVCPETTGGTVWYCDQHDTHGNADSKAEAEAISRAHSDYQSALDGCEIFFYERNDD